MTSVFGGRFAIAQRFLDIIGQGARQFTFQTFADNSVQTDAALLTRILHGTLDDMANTLADLNMAGGGVFATINETDLCGRKNQNMVRPRAVWIEADDGWPSNLPLPPSMTVESSPGRYHIYYIVADLTWPQFEGIMRRLVRDFKCDPNATDRARVLRLPGFDHLKHTRHQVRIIDDHSTGTIYTTQQLIVAFPPIERTIAVAARRKTWNGSENEKLRVIQALRAIEQGLEKTSGRTVLQTPGHDEQVIDWFDYGWWLTAGFCLHEYFKGDEVGYEIWVAASRGDSSFGLIGCPEKFDELHQRQTWDSFQNPSTLQPSKSPWRTIGTLFWAAKRLGGNLNGRPVSAQRGGVSILQCLPLNR